MFALVNIDLNMFIKKMICNQRLFNELSASRKQTKHQFLTIPFYICIKKLRKTKGCTHHLPLSFINVMTLLILINNITPFTNLFPFAQVIDVLQTSVWLVLGF